MLRNRFRIVTCLIALAAALAWTSDASAVCAVSYPGLTTFDGADDFVVLPNVSIGLEGTVSLQFKADDIAGMHGIWYCADGPGGINHEYRLNLTQNHIWAQLWPCDCTTNRADFHLAELFPDTASWMARWHSVSLSWKDGYDTLLTLDGVQTRARNIYPNGADASLSEFTSPTGCHALGYSMQSGPTAPRYFDGQIRNLYVYDTYRAPEPSVVALMITGLLALLGYVWRKRR